MTSFTVDTQPHRLVDVGHARLAYYRFGQGPNVVFVHGWPLHAATFRHLVDGLADRYTCHLFDLPGAGRSEWDTQSKISLDEHVESLALALDELALSEFGLVGHDSGGLIARRLAVRYAGRVQILVLSGTEIPDHYPWQLKMYQVAGGLWGPAAFQIFLRTEFLRNLRFGFGGCLSSRSYANDVFFDLFLRPLVTDRRRLIGQLRALQHFSRRLFDTLAEDHAAIEVPVLMIWGDDDPFFPVARARPMSEQFGGPVQFEVIDGGRLFVHEDHSDRYLDLMRPFLLQHMPVAEALRASVA